VVPEPGSTSSATTAIGAVVRAKRVEAGLSLRGMAGRLQISPATLSLLETGQARFTLDRLHSVSRILSIDLADLLSEADLDALGPPRATGPLSAASRPENVEVLDWRAYPPLSLDPVLQAALKCFAEKGYVGASIRDIATAAGMSVSGIYHYHESKHDMLTALIVAATSESKQRVEAARREGSTPVQRFTLMVQAMCHFHLYRRDLSLVSLSELQHLERDAFRRASPDRWAVQTMIDLEIAEAIDSGDFHTTEPQEAGRAVVMLTSALPRRYAKVDRALIPDITRIYTHFCLALVEHRPSGPASSS